MTDAITFLMELAEKAEGTVFEPFISYIILFSIIIAVVAFILRPLGKLIKKLWDYIYQRRFIKHRVYANLSFMESADIYYAIHQFIPTRFSSYHDPGNDDEPAPIYVDPDHEREPLLIERFIKFEFDIKGGHKYYLCLADCGMGKTTFLINLYYRILKQGKYPCHFISLQNPDCLEQIGQIREKGKTILLLDALDENDSAMSNYNAFMEKLEQVTQAFYRVVITSRTNFFESGTKERLSEHKKISSTTSKLPRLKKFYITPFTDEDIQRFLSLRYRFKRKKRKRAWKIISQNKNLSVRPLLLRFMDELLENEQTFQYDFQLYGCLFDKWIAREKRSFRDEDGKELYAECEWLAKTIYYQWMKNGQIGIYLNELPENLKASGLAALQLKGHAMLNRTSDGLYKFSHKSYWEYMLAKLALSDLYFANDLLLQNFDRATSFFEEMIQFYQMHPDEQTPEICIGTGIYLMKYKKPEDAEEQLRKAVGMCDPKDQRYLLAMIPLARCLHRQAKHISEENVLRECLALMDEVELTKETVPLYTQFGLAFAAYCKVTHLKAGQEFLLRIIEFCSANNLKDYSLLRCYEAYCHCGVNYYLNQQALNEMEQLIQNYFQNDQYAVYLGNLAKSWKMAYSDRKLYEIFQKVKESDMRFMDLFEQMGWNCELGICCTAVNPDDVEMWNNIAAEWLNQGWNICCSVYAESEVDKAHNPYAAYIYWGVVRASQRLNGINDNRVRAYIQMLMQYIEESHQPEEMWIEQIRLLRFIQREELGEFPQIEQAMHKQLEIAKKYGSTYSLIDAYWDLFVLYDHQDETKATGQKYLKQAYELAKDSSDYRMTNEYCILLQVVLDFFEGEIDKAAIAQELVEITPLIYGSDTRRSRIYRGLQRYFSAHNDAREMDACFELLSCDFNADGLNRYYQSCVKYQAMELFFEKLNILCLEKGILSSEELLCLKEFASNMKNVMEPPILQGLDALIKRNQTFQRMSGSNVSFLK